MTPITNIDEVNGTYSVKEKSCANCKHYYTSPGYPDGDPCKDCSRLGKWESHIEELDLYDDKKIPTFVEGCLPDSGERRTFSTGSVRDIREGKGRYDLVSPWAIKALATRMQDGMDKYGERNWEKGQPVMSYMDSAMRHMQNCLEDYSLGQTHKEDHLAAALWNIGAVIHTLKMIETGLLPDELDDRPYPNKKEKESKRDEYTNQNNDGGKQNKDSDHNTGC